MAGRVRGLIAAALLGTILAGCGEEGAARFAADEPLGPGGGGGLTIALPAAAGYRDPLHARTPAAQLVARQVFEPLVSRQRPPVEGGEPQPGLALDSGHSADFHVWRFRLRPDVDFQDGEPFNGAAVSANARRWISDPVAAALLPGLIAADAPRPNLVRFIFSVPVADLPRRLADPRLGLVSPTAMTAGPPGGGIRALNAGTGPFRLPAPGASGGRGSELVLRRNQRWWGGRRGLGPALDELIFQFEQAPEERLRLLESGRVRLAVQLPPALAPALRRNPLVTWLTAEGSLLAFERSVHGLGRVQPQALTGVWITLVQGGGSPAP